MGNLSWTWSTLHSNYRRPLGGICRFICNGSRIDGHRLQRCAAFRNLPRPYWLLDGIIQPPFENDVFSQPTYFVLHIEAPVSFADRVAVLAEFKLSGLGKCVDYLHKLFVKMTQQFKMMYDNVHVHGHHLDECCMS